MKYRTYGGQFASKQARHKAIRTLKLKLYILLASITLSALVIIGFGKFVEYEIESAPIAQATVKRVEPVKELSMQDWVLNEVEKAGINKYKVWALINCESGWRADAVNAKNTNGTYDLGLWQINSIHKDISNADKMDYKKATAWAIKKIQKSGYKAWAYSNKI